MNENKTFEKIGFLREKESNIILKFLGFLAFLTLVVLFFFIGFFGEPSAWQVYFIALFVLVVWAAFRLLELEAEIEELKEKNLLANNNLLTSGGKNHMPH